MCHERIVAVPNVYIGLPVTSCNRVESYQETISLPLTKTTQSTMNQSSRSSHKQRCLNLYCYHGAEAQPSLRSPTVHNLYKARGQEIQAYITCKLPFHLSKGCVGRSISSVTKSHLFFFFLRLFRIRKHPCSRAVGVCSKKT